MHINKHQTDGIVRFGPELRCDTYYVDIGKNIYFYARNCTLNFVITSGPLALAVEHFRYRTRVKT